MRALEGFFSAYFHQDWDLDGDTPESLIELHLQSEAPQTIRQAADELESLLAGSPDDLNVILEQRLGCYYSPLQQGIDVEVWLRRVLHKLRSHASSEARGNSEAASG